MADVYFRCKCGRSLAVDERGIGRTILCKSCGKPVEVPDYDFEFSCPVCSSKILVPESVAGDHITCASCDHWVTVPGGPSNGIAGKEQEEVAVPDAKRVIDEFMRQREESRMRLNQPSHPALTIKPFHLVVAVVLLIALGWSIRFTPWDFESDSSYKKSPVDTVSDKGQDMEMAHVARETIRPKHLEPNSDLERKPEVITNTELFRKRKEPAYPAIDLKVGFEEKAVDDVNPSTHAPLVVPIREEVPLKDGLSPDLAEIRRAWTNLEFHVSEGGLKRRGGRLSQSPEFLKLLEETRHKINKYTRTHSGENLDYLDWGLPFQTVYSHLTEKYARNYEEAHTFIEEGLSILRGAEGKNPITAERVAIHIVNRHIHKWVDKEPIQCAVMLDREFEQVQMSSSDRLYGIWQSYAPILELRLLKSSEQLSPVKREIFFEKRLQGLKKYALDDTKSLRHRLKPLRVWIVYRHAFGKWEQAASVLEQIREDKEGDIKDPDYYFCRMWVELYGENNWQKASESLESISKLVKEGCLFGNVDDYYEMTKAYYDRILFPCYELKRMKSAAQKEI